VGLVLWVKVVGIAGVFGWFLFLVTSGDGLLRVVVYSSGWCVWRIRCGCLFGCRYLWVWCGGMSSVGADTELLMFWGAFACGVVGLFVGFAISVWVVVMCWVGLLVDGIECWLLVVGFVALFFRGC